VVDFVILEPEMKLSELEHQFLKYADKIYHHVDDIKEADGILFLCP
jgi:hypothetical protein